MPQPRFVAESQSRYSCWNGEDERIISTDLDIWQNPKYRCMRDLFTIMHIERARGGRPKPLAKIVACDVRKNLQYSGTSRHIWLDEMLGVPHNYTGNLDQHSDGSDPIDDKKKPFVLLYNRDGSPKRHLSEDARAALSQKRVHYVLEIVIEDDFRGKSLLPQVLLAYQKALRELPGILALKEAALILSPAPMLRITEEMREDGRMVQSHRPVAWRLTENYRWAGLETWKPYPIGVPSGLMIMGKRISDAIYDLDEEDLMNEDDEDEDQEEDQTFASRSYHISRRKPRSEADLLRIEGPRRPKTIFGSYWWYNGKQYLITPQTRPEDAEEGNLQQQMWLEMIKSMETEQHPHEKIIGLDAYADLKWNIDGIIGERDHEGETLYLVEWADILHNGQRYHPPPTWEPASTFRPGAIEEWHAEEAKRKGMLRRNRRRRRVWRTKYHSHGGT